MKRIFLALAVVLCTSAAAQTTAELMLFSQNNFGISTARSAAMGGAFTSLGADISSMSINPAGIGMYNSGEVSISPGLRFGNSKVNYSNGAQADNTTNKMTIGSFGAVYTVDGFSFGFGMNRLADYYSNSSSIGHNQSTSMTDMFASQLSGIKTGTIGIPENDIYRAFFNYPPIMWGSILGYQTFAVNNFDGSDDQYGSALNAGALNVPTMSRRTSGALDEFTFTLAHNSDDKFYFGMTIGAQSLTYNKFDSYTEIAEHSNTATLSDMTYNRNLYLTGAGVNFKLGAIYRPMDWLRFGVSYHSPTWTTINEESDENMTSYYFDSPEGNYSDTPIMTSKYNTYSPSRLLVGASITIANRAIISVDYKRTWMGSMGFSTQFNEYNYRPEITSNAIDNYTSMADNISSRGDIDLNGMIKNGYRSTNNVSVGAEVNLGGGMFVRAGYIYQDSPYKDPQLKEYGKVSQYSAGIGYRNRRISLDLAYINSQSKQLPYQYYSYSGIEPTGYVFTNDIAQNLILSLGFRF